MANSFYSQLLFFVLITIAQPIKDESNDISSTPSISSLTSTESTMAYENHDESFYNNENENSGGDMYDDEEGEDSSDMNSSPTTNSHNITSHLNQDAPTEAYEDEIGLYQEEDDDDDETEETPMYGDTRSVDRLGLYRPTIDSTPQKTAISPTTSRMSFVPTDLWTDLFSKPAMLVGITGAIIIGMLSAILLVMFIIYRMRKKDEGSYVLEEAPRKSPSHAYTRVSSREFFA